MARPVQEFTNHNDAGVDLVRLLKSLPYSGFTTKQSGGGTSVEENPTSHPGSPSHTPLQSLP